VILKSTFGIGGRSSVPKIFKRKRAAVQRNIEFPEITPYLWAVSNRKELLYACFNDLRYGQVPKLNRRF